MEFMPEFVTEFVPLSLTCAIKFLCVSFFMAGKIQQLNFEYVRSNSEVIWELLETIEYYRKEGKSLFKIYGALRKDGSISMVYGSFRNVYYRQRRLKNQCEEKEGFNSVSIKTFSTVFRKDASLSSAKSEEKSAQPRRMIDLSMSLEEHQAAAKIAFGRQ
jgi:hypothetical protein